MIWFFSAEDDKKAEEKCVTSNQLLQVIEEAYPNSLTLDDMSR
jgi:hypothetical protein